MGKKRNCKAWCSQLCLANRKSANQFPRTILPICLRFHFNFQQEIWVSFFLEEDSVLMEGCQGIVEALTKIYNPWRFMYNTFRHWKGRIEIQGRGQIEDSMVSMLMYCCLVINKVKFSHCFLSLRATSVLAAVAAVSYVASLLTLQRRALVQRSCKNSFSTENPCVSVFLCWRMLGC